MPICNKQLQSDKVSNNSNKRKMLSVDRLAETLAKKKNLQLESGKKQQLPDCNNNKVNIKVEEKEEGLVAPLDLSQNHTKSSKRDNRDEKKVVKKEPADATKFGDLLQMNGTATPMLPTIDAATQAAAFAALTAAFLPHATSLRSDFNPLMVNHPSLLAAAAFAAAAANVHQHHPAALKSKK